MNAVSFTVEKIVECYESEYELAVQEHENQVDNCRVITRQANEHVEYTKNSVNILVFVAYLYVFNLTTSALLLDLLKECTERFTELDIESLFIVMKIAGFKLRGDSPSDLKDLILAIKQKADSDEWKQE